MLKKLGVVTSGVALALTLTACSEESTEKEVKETPVEESTGKEVKETPEKKKDEKPKEETKKVVLVDDANVKITFTGLKESTNSIMGKEAKLKLDVENKTDKDIIVQSDKISVDGTMFKSVAYSEEITPNSKSSSSIHFMELDKDTEFPKFKDNVKGEIVILSADFDRIATHKFNLSFK